MAGGLGLESEDVDLNGSLALLVITCVTLGKSPIVSALQFLHL